jgi:MTH538 TIR-like domain (DUF1863)
MAIRRKCFISYHHADLMGRIRADYIKDSTVTIVLAGKCIWARRYVDWEIQASLRAGQTVSPNGLLGLKLLSPTGRNDLTLIYCGKPTRLLRTLVDLGKLDS